MVAAAGPCNGHTACLSPGIAQPEGQTGLFYVTVGIGPLIVGFAGSVLLTVKYRRLIRSQRLTTAGRSE